MKIFTLIPVISSILVSADSYAQEGAQLVFPAQAGAMPSPPPPPPPPPEGPQGYSIPNAQTGQVTAGQIQAQEQGQVNANAAQQYTDNLNNTPTAPAPTMDPNNIFLENYVRRGVNVTADVYRKDAAGRLFRQRLSKQDLRKAVVVFFGDWCPHCAKFLGDFAQHLSSLTAAGIKIWFIGVPSVERLQNWKEPNESDYQDALGKLNSFGIQLSSSVELVLLGNRDTLNNNAIDSLPTMLATLDGKESFRGSSDDSIQKVNLSDAANLQHFLNLWPAEQSNDRKSTTQNRARSNGYSQQSCIPSGRVNREVADLYAEVNNATGCGCRGVSYGLSSRQKHLKFKQKNMGKQTKKGRSPHCNTRPLKDRMDEWPPYVCRTEY